jgi:WD40 repeat protein
VSAGYSARAAPRAQAQGAHAASAGEPRAITQPGSLLRGWRARGTASAIAFAPDGKSAVSGTIESGLVLWDVGRGRAVHQANVSHGSVVDLEFTPDGGVVVAGTNEGFVCFWRIRLSPPPSCARTAGETVHDVAVSRDGTVALGTSSGVELWDPVRGRRTGRLDALGRTEMLAVTFSPDQNRVLAVGADGIGRIADRRLGRVTREYEVGYGGGSSIRYSPDARLILVTGGQIGPLVTVLNTDQGREVGGAEGIWADDAVFTPDGRHLVIASAKGLHIAPVAGGSRVRRLGGMAGVFPLGISRDGRLVLTWTTDDGTFRLWRLP